jgi:hypothetical protein
MTAPFALLCQEPGLLTLGELELLIELHRAGSRGIRFHPKWRWLDGFVEAGLARRVGEGMFPRRVVITKAGEHIFDRLHEVYCEAAP